MFLFLFCADVALATVALGAVYLQELPQPWLRAVFLHWWKETMEESVSSSWVSWRLCVKKTPTKVNYSFKVDNWIFLLVRS